MKRHLFPAFLLFLLAFVNYASAQNEITRQDLFWARHYLSIDLNKGYKFRHEIEERVFIKNWRKHQFMTRAFIDRNLGKGWNTALGLSYFNHAHPRNPNLETDSIRMELRPVIEFGNQQILSERFSLNHRYWQEFRFFEQPDNSIDFRNLRFRYRLELRYRALDFLTFRLLDEIHINAGRDFQNQIFDQNRIALAAQVFPFEKWGFEIAYVYWFQQISGTSQFYQRDIFRFTAFLNLNMGSSGI